MFKRFLGGGFGLLLGCLLTSQVLAQTLPSNALVYLPMLQSALQDRWSDINTPWVIAGQIEQETCPSLRNSECWNPHAELKTYREYGFGLGQLTVTSSFNAFNDVKGLDSTLRPWKWTNRYDPQLQLRAMVDMDRADYRYFSFAATPLDDYAFMLAAYNGGPGGTMLSVRYCLALADCNHRIWFDNVETHSYKSKTSLGAAYGGQSAYNINRDYVRNVLQLRMQKYQSFFDEP